MRSNSGKVLTSRVLLAAVAVLVITSLAQARSYEFEDSFSYEVQESFRLTIDNEVGSILIAPSRDGQLSVHVLKVVDAVSSDEAAEIRDDIDVRIDQSPADVSIRARYSNRKSGRGFWKQVFGIGGRTTGEVHLRVDVPKSVELSISAGSADVEISSIKGNVRLELTSGEVRLRDIEGSCQIDATSGDIEARDIKGDLSVSATSSNGYYDNIDGELDVDATSGDTEAHWVSGSIRVEKSSGGTKIMKSSGDIDINSTSGDITIVQRSGNLWVRSHSGNIDIESEMTEGETFEVSSTSGDITLRIPEETGVDIMATTGSGDIDTEAEIKIISLGKNELEGTIGKGGKRLRLNSSSGNISLLTY